jgi:hypothetical protein
VIVTGSVYIPYPLYYTRQQVEQVFDISKNYEEPIESAGISGDVSTLENETE